MDFNLTEEQQMWQSVVHDFCAREVKPKAGEFDEQAVLHQEAFEKMAPMGLLGLVSPERYGGAGVDAISMAIAIEQFG